MMTLDEHQWNDVLISSKCYPASALQWLGKKHNAAVVERSSNSLWFC